MAGEKHVMPSGMSNAVQEPLAFLEIGRLNKAAVQRALANPAWDFRTIPGIAKEIGISEFEVARILRENPAMFRKSAIPDRLGRPLFTLKGNPVSLRERIAALRMFLTKSIA